MKKIVALVLSLVMVLGLATTAFAAPTGAYIATDVNTLENSCDLTQYSYELKKHVDEIAVTRSFETYAIWETTLATKAPAIKDGQYYVIATSAKSADIAFVDGTNVTYLQKIDHAFDGKWPANMVLTKVDTVKAALAGACGDVYVKGGYTLYENAAGDLFIENGAGTTFGYVDGKFAWVAAVTVEEYVTAKAFPAFSDASYADGSVITITHNYDFDIDTVNSVQTVKKVYCTACKADFQFVVGTPATAIAAFGADNFEATTKTVPAGTVFVALEPVAADTPAVDTEKVESAETFDAGIAMYVGMSVMAAAGSAVVLKKKD